MGTGRGVCVTSARRDRLGRVSIRQPGGQFQPSRRSDLGGREPIPVLQADQIVRACTRPPSRGARRCGERRCRPTSSGAPSAASTIPTARMRRTPTSAPRPPASAMSKAGWAGRRRPSVRPATTATADRARYLALCERKYSWGTREGRLRAAGGAHGRDPHSRPSSSAAAAGDCIWSWQPRKAGGKAESKTLACKDKLTIARVPYSHSTAASSGVARHGEAAGRPRAGRAEVVVEDLFIVALGDSFASGESNPDRPVHVQRRRARWSTIPTKLREDQVASRGPTSAAAAAGFGLASIDDQLRSQDAAAAVHGRRGAGRFHKLELAGVRRGVREASARWISADCHRSQYGYPFRVAMQLALENRHRAVTLVSFTCTGAEVAEGLFLRDGCARGSTSESKVAPAQFDQLSDLICRGNAHAERESTRCRVFARQHQHHAPADHQGLVPAGTAQAADRRRADVDRRQRRRLRRARRLRDDRGRRRRRADRRAGRQQDPLRPARSRASISSVLDERMKAVKDALTTASAFRRARVVQTSYEPIQYDETGALCGAHADPRRRRAYRS